MNRWNLEGFGTEVHRPTLSTAEREMFPGDMTKTEVSKRFRTITTGQKWAAYKDCAMDKLVAYRHRNS